MGVPGWDRLSRDERVRLLARGPEEQRICPACLHMVAVVHGYWTQHTDQRSREGKPRQCINALTEVAPSQKSVGSASLSEGACDCENPEPEEGVALLSMTCPVHNIRPEPDGQ